MTSDAIVEGLCGAISTIVSSALQDLSYDQTIICTIVDNSKSSNGEYKVTDGSTEFVAKSENTSYQKDDQVRVSILKGDMTQEKFIIGKYVNSDSNVPITYMSPLDSVMKMTDNLFTGKKDDDKPYGLYANGQKTLSNANDWEPKREQEILSTITLGDNQSSMINTQIYDTAYIQLDLKTLMFEYNIVSGHYGIGVSLGLVKDQKYVSSADYIFDSSQMLGNPYNFGIYTQQAAKFDIKSVGTINTIVVFWYQDGNFKHITHSDEEQYVESYAPNILAKNITIGFGSNVINVADDTIKLFSLDEEQYNGDDSDSERLRELKVAWYNKNDLGQSINFNDAAVSEEITDDNIIKTIKMGDSLIKFIDEYKYRELSETNNRRNAQIDYDIPMDIQGLELAAAIKKINEKLKSLSLIISKDLHQIIEKFKARCNISVFTNYYEEYKVSEIINNQYISIDSTKTLPETIDTFFKNYMDALNRAAKKYNKVPSTVSSEGWNFKSTTTDKPDNSWIENELFETYFEETLKDCLNNFLNNLKIKISSEYSGYMGIYDNYESKINKILNNVDEEWKEITLIIKSFSYPISEKENSTPQSLKNAVLSYWSVENYPFLQWTAQDLTDYENAYSVYWYRSNGLAIDSIAGKGWQLIENSYDENDTEQSIDYTNYEQIKILLEPTKEKEEFKVLLFFNHRQHESNTIVFENTTDFNKQIANANNYITIAHGTNSHESYQSYGPTNTLLNGAEKYRSRELNISYTNHETGQIENNNLENAQIYWYIPKHSTMLIYDTNDLINLNEQNHFVNDLNSKVDNTDKASERQKSGYTMFYKTIKNLEKDLKFSYRIKDYYVPSATQNHILCDVVIDDVVYTSEILMNFSSYGTSGSDYTLVVSPHTSQAAITLNNKDIDSAWLLDITLYDSNNQEVDLSDKNVAITTAKISDIVVNLINNNQIAAYIPEVKNDNGDIVTPKPLGDVLEVIVTISKDATTNRAYDLTTYYSIPYSADSDAFIEGASTIIYDSSGGFPTYYKNPYKYFNNNIENTTVKWSLTYSSNASDNTISKLTPYMPKLENDNTLTPCNMWVKDCNVDGETSYYECIQCYKNTIDLLWSQPLIIMQNRYPSPMLNKWDGSLKIDEENGTILSTTVGAGKKNSDNSFSGILMGDVSDAAESNYTGMGLYGFYHGKQSFGFNVDGTAFLGEANGGRITFDGNKGLIKSQSYDNKLHSGMSIDIDDGIIDIKGGCYDYDENGDIKKDESGNLLYNENQKPSRIIINSKSPYFEIISKNDNSLMKVSDKDYYLKSDNFNDTDTGTKFDLWDGSLIGYNFTLKALSNNNGVILSSKGTDEEPYFAIKNGDKNLLYVDDNEFYLKSKDENLNFDVANGSLIATNFILKALNENGAGIILQSNGEPYFQVNAANKDSDGKNWDLLTISNEKFELHSLEPEVMNIDITNGSIYSTNFSLTASSGPDESSSGISINSGKYNKDEQKIEKYLSFLIKAQGKPLIHIKDDANYEEQKFFLASYDWDLKDHKGTFLDLKNGSFQSYNFNLIAYGKQNQHVIIDSNATNNPFNVNDKFKINWDGSFMVNDGVFSVDAEGNAKVVGDITANSLTLGSTVNISTDNITGLSDVATSGDYTDLLNSPKNLSDFEDDLNIITQDDIDVQQNTDADGLITTITKVGNKEYTTYTSDKEGYVLTNLGIGKDEDGERFFKVQKDGLLTAKNAMIWGTIYASAGEFTGKITAGEGSIGGWQIGKNMLESVNPSTSAISSGSDVTDNEEELYNPLTMKLYSTGKLEIKPENNETLENNIYKKSSFIIDEYGTMHAQKFLLSQGALQSYIALSGKTRIKTYNTQEYLNVLLKQVAKQPFNFTVEEDCYYNANLFMQSGSVIHSLANESLPYDRSEASKMPDTQLQANSIWIGLGDLKFNNQISQGMAALWLNSPYIKCISRQIELGQYKGGNEVEMQNYPQGWSTTTSLICNAGTIRLNGRQINLQKMPASNNNQRLNSGFEPTEWIYPNSSFQDLTVPKYIKNDSGNWVENGSITNQASNESLKTYIFMLVLNLIENYYNKPYDPYFDFDIYKTKNIDRDTIKNFVVPAPRANHYHS